MGSPARRTKRYRPRVIGRPITGTVRNELVLPAYVALQHVQFGTDRDALESSRHTLAALFDYMLVALQGAGRDTSVIEAGLCALVPMIRRFEAGQSFRATGPELAALQASVRHADEVLGTLRTDQIIGAVAKVNRLIEAGVVVNELRAQPMAEPATTPAPGKS